ncbi:hypothetical protein N9D12_00665 [Candidatus Pelagibacter sp.]|nr:hypothetical protein [Candidatus Pelagibacter sp.]
MSFKPIPTLDGTQANFTGSITMTGDIVATQDWVASQNYLTSETDDQTLDEVLTQGNVSASGITVGSSTISGAGTSTFTVDSTNSFGRELTLSTNGILPTISANTDLLIETSNNDTQIKLEGGSNTDNIQFIANEVEQARITTAGVGIGTTSPDSKLHAYQTISTAPSIVSRVPFKTNADAQLKQRAALRIDINEGGSSLSIGGIGSANSGFIQSYSTNSTSTHRNFVLNPFGGNVGIGTTSPEANLHVWASESGQTATNVTGLFLENGGDSNSYYVFQTATNVGKSFSITNAGNVGIGTTSPTEKLHIESGNLLIKPNAVSASHSGLLLGINKYNSGKAGLWGATDGAASNTDGNIYISTRNASASNGSYIQLGQRDSTTASDKGTIVLQAGAYNTNSQTGDILLKYGITDTLTLQGSSGNVGIGTTSPSWKLHVNSTTRAAILGNGTPWKSDGVAFIGSYYGTHTPLLVDHHNASTNSSNFAEFRNGDDDIAIKLKADGSADFAGDLAVSSGNIKGSSFTIGTDTAYTNDLNITNSGKIRIGNTEFFAKSSNDLSIYSGKLNVTSTGNVGIGTTSPTRPLEIYKTGTEAPLQVRSNLTTYTGIGFRESSGTGADMGFVGIKRTDSPSSSDSEIHIRNSKSGTVSTSMMIDTSGNVGIGTTSPSNKLTVTTSTISDGVFIETSQPVTYAKLFNSNSESFPVGNLHLGYGSNSTAIIQALSNRMSLKGGYSTGGQISFSSASLEIMRMTSTGLGIGTTSPDYLLDIGGDTSSANNTIRMVQANNGTAIRIGAGGDSNDVNLLRVDGGTSVNKGESDSANFGFSLRYKGSGSGANNSLAFFADNSTAGSQIEALTILNDGKVGIGSISPSSILHLASTGPAVLTIEADTDNATETDNARIVLKQDGGAVVGRIGYENNTNALEIINEFADSLSLGTNNNKRFTITGAGNASFTGAVGINTSSPAQELHVYQGTAQFESTNGGGFSLLLGRSDVANLWGFNHAGNDLRIYNAGGSGYDILLGVNAGGTSQSNKVGINTANPSTALHVEGTITHKVYTVAALPSASPAGQRSFVSDASSVLDVNLGATVSAGGSNLVPVFSDGSNWIVG